MKTILQLAASVTFAVALLGQAPPKDVDGWGKIKWGMTVAQAKALYGAQAQASGGANDGAAKYVEKLVIKNFAVGDLMMDVSIETPTGSNLVKEVSLKLAGDPKPEDVEAIRKYSDDSRAAYSYLRDLLIQKYGRPSNGDKNQDNGVDSSWTCLVI